MKHFSVVLLGLFFNSFFVNAQNGDPEFGLNIPYSDFGSGEDYDHDVESSLQDNYMFRWPIPFVPGEFNVRIKIHYLNAQGSTVPSNVISDAKTIAYDIYGEKGINLVFVSDQVYQPQEWQPSSSAQDVFDLHHDFFISNPPSSGFESDLIHVAIFDKAYVLNTSVDLKTPRDKNSPGPGDGFSRVNIYWKRIPSRTVSIGWPNEFPSNSNHHIIGPFNESKIVEASLLGALGTSLGLMPLKLGYPMGNDPWTTDYEEREQNNNCHKAGDFICDTKPMESENGSTIFETSFDQNTCDFTFKSSSGGFLTYPGNNVMAYYAKSYQCIDHITEEQARKIRYVFSNDSEMHDCLDNASTLAYDNFMLTPLRTVITQNTTWTKPAALHILEIEEGAVFTTESSIDFAPGTLKNNYTFDPSTGFEVIRSADYSNGYNHELIFNDRDFDDVYKAFARVGPTSRLNVYGGSLNNYFSYWPWQGIVAVGDRTQPQTQAHQAVLHFQDATVRMAHEAIYPSDRVKVDEYNDGPRIGSTTGSYVLAFDTDFINCRRVIGFREYANMRTVGGNPRELNNASHFTRCNIIHDDGYRFSNIPLGITLNRVMGVRILGCSFENTMTNDVAQNLSSRGHAVFAQSAHFIMNESCMGSNCIIRTPSSITGYDRGVFAQRNHPSLSRTVVKNTNFHYNAYTAYFENNNFFEFEDNELYLPPGLQNLSNFRSYSPYGLYVKSSTDFSVEGNYITEASTVPSYLPITFPSNPVGMVVNSTYTHKDAAYRNTFDGLELGILALGQNRTKHWDGFQIRCNVFDEGAFDILVPMPDMYPENSVSHFQGYLQVGWEPTDLANNLFSHINTDPNIPTDFDNNGPYYVHYAYASDPSEPRNRPINVHRVHDMLAVDETDWEDRCPPGILNIKMDSTLVSFPRVELDDLKDDYLSDVELLGQLIDQGNTPQLLGDIFSSPESEYYDMFLDLMSQSPYLSEEVLIEVINIPDFPDVLLRNILMENPQSVTNEAVETAILERIPALPQYMIDDIFNGTDLFGPKEALESRIAHKNAKFKRFAASLIKALTKEMAMNDEDAWLTDSLLSLFDAINTPHSMLMKAAYLQNYAMDGHATAYQSAINLANGSDTLMHGEFEGFAEMLEIMLNAEDSISGVDAQTIELWRNSDYPAAQSMAYGLMREFGVATDSLLIDPVVMPAPMSSQRIAMMQDKAKSKANRMKLYPNPASDYTVLHYEITGVDRALHYRMMDIHGKVLMRHSFDANVKGDEIIALPNVANGTYIIVIEEESGKMLESIKLNVFR